MKKVFLALLAIMVAAFGFSGVLAEGIKDDLVIGVAQEINELNPMMQNDQINNNCFALTHERLVFLDNGHGYEIYPEVAESWEWTDETHLVFHLNPNVKFSNGTPLTADDVVFTLNRARSDDPTLSKVSGQLGLVTDVSKIDDYTVQVTTSAYSNELIYNFGSYPLAIQSKAAYEDANNAEPWLIGSGPYSFKEWQEGQYVTFKIGRAHV